MTLLRIAFAAVLALGFQSAYAFHSGGVAECGGCHSMHSPAAGGSFLLVGRDQSSACLSCHENANDTGPTQYHISTADTGMPAGVAPLQRTPGGDFGWLKKDYTFTVRGTIINEEGQTHGHSIVALDKSYGVDPVNATAPGGNFPSAQLACNSCHDPHGKYRRMNDGSIATTGAPIVRSGSYNTSLDPNTGEAVGVYRLLAGVGYEKASFPGVPAAVAPSTYNRTEALTQTRVAYGINSANGHTSWGNWCGTCHGAMHSGGGNYVHPVDQNVGSTIATVYQTYVKSGDMTATPGNGFTSLVPFATAGTYADLRALAQNNDSVLTGPSTASQVTCLSCHRAHASGWKHALRWNMEGEFMTYSASYPGTDTTAGLPQFHNGRTSAETQAAYYDRPVTAFATYQRVLCNKCHAKD